MEMRSSRCSSASRRLWCALALCLKRAPVSILVPAQTTTLLGMAIALLVSTALTFPTAILAKVDNQAQVAIVFLAASVLLNVAVFRARHGEGTRPHAYMLFAVYAAFLVVVSVVEAGYVGW